MAISSKTVSLRQWLFRREVTVVLNMLAEKLLPPCIGDTLFMAKLANFLAGKGFTYIDPFNSADERLYTRDINYTQKELEEILSAIQGKTVLDVGCGSGRLVETLRQNGFEAYGVDLRKSNNPYCYQGYVQELFQHKPYFDTITCVHTLEHIPHCDEMYHELRKHANRLIVIVPCQRYRKYVYDGHVRFFPDEFQLRIQLKLPESAVVKKVSGDWFIVDDCQAVGRKEIGHAA